RDRPRAEHRSLLAREFLPARRCVCFEALLERGHRGAGNRRVPARNDSGERSPWKRPPNQAGLDREVYGAKRNPARQLVRRCKIFSAPSALLCELCVLRFFKVRNGLFCANKRGKSHQTSASKGGTS